MREPLFDPKILDDLSKRLADSLPAGVRALQGDLENNFRATLEGLLAKMDLVTREEFDAQTAVLARTRAKLDELAARVAALEQTDDRKAPPSSE